MCCRIQPSDIVMMIGNTNSGKSTFVRQLRIYFDEYDVMEKVEFRSQIRRNLGETIERLWREYQTCGDDDILNASRAMFERLSDNFYVVDEVEVEDYDKLYRRLVEKRSTRSPRHSWMPEYWVTRHMDIMSPGYIPTVEDIIRMRYRTLGANVVKFGAITVVDCGGQLPDRRKWLRIAQAENINRIFFFISCEDVLDEYRKQSSIEVFTSFLDEFAPELGNVELELLFTKVDLIDDRRVAALIEEYQKIMKDTLPDSMVAGVRKVNCLVIGEVLSAFSDIEL
nr:guanine nucleotide-binding protein subunit alpha-11-like [Kaumoebavirus]